MCAGIPCAGGVNTGSPSGRSSRLGRAAAEGAAQGHRGSRGGVNQAVKRQMGAGSALPHQRDFATEIWEQASKLVMAGNALCRWHAQISSAVRVPVVLRARERDGGQAGQHACVPLQESVCCVGSKSITDANKRHRSRPPVGGQETHQTGHYFPCQSPLHSRISNKSDTIEEWIPKTA